MTIEEVLEMSGAQLVAMTDDEWKGHFEKYFKCTRPELIQRAEPRNPTGKATSITQTKQFGVKADQLKALGILSEEDIAALKKSKYKKT